MKDLTREAGIQDLQSISAEKKLRLASDLYQFAFRIKFGELKRRHPHEPEEVLREQVQKMIERANE